MFIYVPMTQGCKRLKERGWLPARAAAAVRPARLGSARLGSARLGLGSWVLGLGGGPPAQ
ncbi:hypothetical protein DY000_02032977 [Brassica cretica]|uniref:Uncharacterized protein n=1 Tax=Brassica cretica TaxID=69181 RepID=A0ABQ7DIC2_BRACR|nr:hypothetical protein DY000_02032977 [Brassica cretica]